MGVQITRHRKFYGRRRRISQTPTPWIAKRRVRLCVTSNSVFQAEYCIHRNDAVWPSSTNFNFLCTLSFPRKWWILHNYGIFMANGIMFICFIKQEFHRRDSLLAREFAMMTSSNGSIFHVTCHLRGEFTGYRSIPRTKASDAALWCFLWCAPEQTVE